MLWLGRSLLWFWGYHKGAAVGVGDPAISQPPSLTQWIRCSSSAIAGATSIKVDALHAAISNGTVLTFSGGTQVTLTAGASSGASSLTVSALSAGVAEGETAQGSVNLVLLDRVSPVMPAPTITDGRPQAGWGPTSVTRASWGRWRAIAGPPSGPLTDITYLRDTPVSVEWLSFADPFGPEAVIIRCPQLTILDVLDGTGGGGLGWLVDGALIYVDRVHPDGSTTTRRWEGELVGWDIEHTETSSSVVLMAVGVLHGLGRFKRAPQIARNATSLDAIVAAEYSIDPGVRPSLRVTGGSVTGGPSGITFTNRPAFISSKEFVRDLLSRSVLAGGADQWTVQWVSGRQWRLVKRSAFGTTYTYTAGTQGLEVRARRDYDTTYNTLYGSGVDTLGGGGEWRNLYINATGGVYFMPIGYLDAVQGLIEDPNNPGDLMTNPATQNTDIPRREEYISFGEGYSLTEAQSIGDRYVDRDSDPGWPMTLVAKVGPEEAHQCDVVAGDRIKLKHAFGSGATGVTAQVARAVYRRAGDIYVAEFTVDTRGRDADTLQKIAERDKQGRQPGRRLRLGSEAVQTADRGVPWDDSNGAGWLPRERAPRFNGGVEGTQTVSCTGGQWNIFEIVAAEGPVNIDLIEVYASISTQFAVVVCDWNVATSHLPANPLTHTTDWAPDVPGVLYAVGMSGHRAGYWKSTEAAGGQVTGVHKDFGGFEIHHRRGTPSGNGDANNSGSPAKAWIGVFPTSTCEVDARLHKGTE